MTQQQKNTILQSTIAMILIAGTGVVMLSSQVPFIRRISEYSVHIMLGMFGFSILALIFDKTKIMFAGLACTAALCIFLKDASNNTLKLPQENTEEKLNVAHINLSNITFEFNELRSLLNEEKIDLVSFQELTPDWNMVLHGLLQIDFPYSKSEVRIDPYGMALFSRIPFKSTEVFKCKDKPNLKSTIEKDGKAFQIICSYLTPALDQKSIEAASAQLTRIAEEIKKSEHPLIALGEFNMVYWTNEIREFRSDTKLTNSRRGLSDGNLRVPYDHIFFSEGLECTEFKEMKDEDQNYIGIMGKYQLRDIEDDSKLSSLIQ
jgi:endonuclease/exonuclease/phosphatase family metal-dependent hydrolase